MNISTRSCDGAVTQGAGEQISADETSSAYIDQKAFTPERAQYISSDAVIGFGTTSWKSTTSSL